MKTLIMAIGFMLLAMQVTAQDQRIYGGEEINISEAPYQALLKSFIGGWPTYGGGVVIDCEWILTAAHNVFDENNNLISSSNLRLWVGTNEIEDLNDGQEIGISEIIPHPNYEPAVSLGNGIARVAENDIALLRLATPIQPNDDGKIKTIIVGTNDLISPEDMSPGKLVYITGWGASEDSNGEAEDKLRGVWAPIISFEEANNSLGVSQNTCRPEEDINENMYFPIYGEGVSAGKGDSGGPAIIKKGTEGTENYLVGITSWGYCSEDWDLVLPSQYINVLNYQDFIEEFMYSSCCDDSLQYHLVDENGKENSFFCLGEDIKINVDNIPDRDPETYYLDLWKVDSNGELDWLSGNNWTEGSPDGINVIELFENNANKPITFENGITYAVKLAVNHPICDWVSQLQYFTFIEEGTAVSYHYENENEENKHRFCLGEDVYLNGSGTIETGNYYMDLWVLDENNDYDWISGAGWTQDFPSFINITELFENDPENPVTFESGKTYSVKLAIEAPCGWEELQRNFSIEPCCEELSSGPSNLQFSTNTLSWEPIPNAELYLVENSPSWPSDCSCPNPISIIPIETIDTSVTFSIGPGRCAAVRIRAICSDFSISPPSDTICIRFDRKMSNISPIASISPNPNSGEMSVREGVSFSFHILAKEQ